MNPGDDDRTRAVDDVRVRPERPTAAVRHARSCRRISEHVADAVESLRRIEDPAALQHAAVASSLALRAPFAASASSGLPPASRYSTAMRIATPFVTWLRITLCGPSATSESISTPRFIGPGCRMSTSRVDALEPLARDAKHAIVFAQRRDVAGRHALELQPQHVERLRPLDRRLDPVEDRHAELRDRVRQQRARAADGDFRAHLLQAPDVRPRDARVQHVAARCRRGARADRRNGRAA